MVKLVRQLVIIQCRYLRLVSNLLTRQVRSLRGVDVQYQKI